MPLSRLRRRKSSVVSPPLERPRGHRRRAAKAALLKAGAGTVRAVKATHAVLRAAGSSATHWLDHGQEAVRMFDPFLLDRLHLPLTRNREC